MTTTMTSIVIPTKIRKIEQKKRLARAWMDENNRPQIEEEILGWAILMEGSWEWLFIGHEKPDLEVGDPVKIIIERNI